MSGVLFHGHSGSTQLLPQIAGDSSEKLILGLCFLQITVFDSMTMISTRQCCIAFTGQKVTTCLWQLKKG